LIHPSSLFDSAWRDGGEIGGGENQVFLSDNGRFVSKRNNLSYHSSYQEFFERLLLHNWMVPRAMLTFEGFSDSPEGLQPLLSQPVIIAASAAFRSDVEPYMQARGFVATDERGWNYFHPEKGFVVEDLHENNAVIDIHGQLVIFDPVIYPNPPMNQWSKLHRLGLLNVDGTPISPR
jgi:hypothetical protein